MFVCDGNSINSCRHRCWLKCSNILERESRGKCQYFSGWQDDLVVIGTSVASRWIAVAGDEGNPGLQWVSVGWGV